MEKASYYTIDQVFADKLSTFLKLMKINYERSGCYDGYCFNLTVTKFEYDMIDSFINLNA